MTLLTDIHVRSFTGLGLRPYIHSVAKLRLEVFKEYPYFKDPDLAEEMRHLRKISCCKESISVLIFDGTTLVGVSIGYPLESAEPSLLGVWKGRHQEISSYFYFENPALLKHYRGRGIGHHFFDAKEAHVVHYKKYKHICFCAPESLECVPDRPSDFISPSDFWRKRGYIHHPEIKGTLSWKKNGEAHPKEHRMSFWVKDVH
jgi:hypothetical protein